MASIVVAGDTSGTVTLAAPAVSGTTTLTLPTTSGTVLTSASTITPSAGTVTQASLSTNVAGNGPAFSAYRQASQSVTSDVYTKIALNTEVFDTNNNFDSTTNYRFTPTVAGYYQFNALICLNGTVSTTQFVGMIAKNGNTSLQRNFDLNPSASLSTNGFLSMSASQLYYLNGSTDYVELYAYYYLGTATISGSGGYQTTILSGSMVRSA